MNSILDTIKDSLNNLLKNKGRTFLSVVGVTIGIATVLIIFSAGEAIKSIVTKEVTSFGTDWIQVEVKVPSTAHASTENAAGQAQGITITTLTLDDAQAIGRLENVRDVYGAILSQKIISYREFNSNVFLFGASASFIDIDASAEVENGRFYTDAEDRSLARVVVLGATVAKDIFGDEDPVGKKVKINRQSFEVVGVMKERGSSLFFDQDTMVYVPVRTVQKQMLGVNYISFLMAKVEDVDRIDFTLAEVEDLLRERHDIDDPAKDDFAASTPQQALGILGSVTGAVSILLLLIASISLIVGSVGIMNIMFVTVSERVPEIGLRKAVGATADQIRWQFLTESMLITLLGGVLGILFGILITILISVVAGQLGFDWPAVLKIRFFLIAVGVSILVGLLAGYYPAMRASKLDPIVALRRED